MENSIAALNIRLGADLNPLRRELQAAERVLKNTAAQLSAIGRNMTMSVTVPLAGIGAYTVKAAGEFESLKLALKTTFEDAGRSVAEANEEFKNLQKSAMAPGLDFPQGLKASIRLQNVGMSAEKARMTVEELANAVSMSGGSAEDLGEVTNQFSQMIGKGKLLNEDLKVIMGRMPKLASVMKEAFGTTDAEKIRAMGITAAEFVDTVVNKMKELPRVEGGINNTFVNLGASVRSFAAAIGEDLNKVLDLKKTVEDFSGWLDRLAQSFRELSPGTKDFIAKAALTVAAIGPVTYAVSLLIKAGQTWVVVAGTAKLAFLELQAAGVALGDKILWLRKAFLSASLAMQAFGALLIAGAIYTAILAYQSFNRELTTAEKVQKSLNDVQTKAEQSIVGERLAAERLIGVLKDENSKRTDKARALNELKAIAPDYFGKLDIERSKTADLTAALDAYVAGLMKAAKAKAAMARIEEIEKQLLSEKEMADAASVSIGTTLVNALVSGRDAAGFAARQAGDFRQNLKSLTDQLNAEKSALEQVVKENANFSQTVAHGNAAVKGRTELTEKQIKAAQKAAEAEKEWADEVALHNALGQFKDFDLAASIKKQTEEATQSTKYLNDQLREMGALMQGEPLPMGADMNRAGTIEQPNQPGLVQPVLPEMASIFEDWKAGIASFKETWDATVASVSASGSVMENVFVAGAGALQQYAEQGGASLRDLAKSALGAAAKVIRAQIMQGVTAAAMKALTSVPFPFNIAAAGAAGALAGTLFNKLISSVGIPALAQGGLAYGPTMAMVGDNPGARSNPEVIAPLSKLESIMGGGNMGGTLSTRISGDDLLILLERSGNKRRRSRGY